MALQLIDNLIQYIDSYFADDQNQQPKSKSKKRPSWNQRWKKFRENKELAPWENTYPNREINYLSHFNNNDDCDTFNIFIPLCGASNDMIHINKYFKSLNTNKKIKIIGLDISSNAIEYFFENQNKLNQTDYNIEIKGNVRKYSSKDGVYTFYVESIFDPNVQELIIDFVSKIGYIDFIYDRAALNCLKPTERSKYILFINKLLNKNGKILLSTLRFNKLSSKKEYLNRGPYSFTNNEVYEHFKDIINNQNNQIKILTSVKWSESEYDDEKSLGKRMGINLNNGFCDIYCIQKSIN